MSARVDEDGFGLVLRVVPVEWCALARSISVLDCGINNPRFIYRAREPRGRADESDRWLEGWDLFGGLTRDRGHGFGGRALALPELP